MNFSVDSTDEWIGEWRGMKFHSTRHRRNTSEQEVREQEARRLPWLADKLMADLEAAEKLFVFSDCDRIDHEHAARLCQAIRNIGEAKLLLVMADPASEPSVETHSDGLLVGFIPRLTPAHYAAEFDWPSWAQLLPLAFEAATMAQRNRVS